MIDVDAAMGTDAGRKYKANFDVAFLETRPLLAVAADGMGDGEGSALAGRTAVDTFVARLREAGGDIGAATIRDAVAVVQDRVHAAGQREGVGLTGCTLSALVDGGAGGWWITQLGDSRVYRLRGDVLELLTVDHTTAWIAISHGICAFDSPQAARARHQLHRYVGDRKHSAPDILSIAPEAGDVFLVCTDGIADQVPYQRLGELLSLDADAHTRVERLLEAAGEAGGGDNATALVVAIR